MYRFAIIFILCMSVGYPADIKIFNELNEYIKNSNDKELKFTNQNDNFNVSGFIKKVESTITNVKRSIGNLEKTNFGYLSDEYRVWLDKDGRISWIQGLNNQNKFDLKITFEGNSVYSISFIDKYIIFNLKNNFYISKKYDFSKYHNKPLLFFINEFSKENKIDFHFLKDISEKEKNKFHKVILKASDVEVNLRSFLAKNGRSIGIRFTHSNTKPVIWISNRAPKIQ